MKYGGHEYLKVRSSFPERSEINSEHVKQEPVMQTWTYNY